MSTLVVGAHACLSIPVALRGNCKDEFIDVTLAGEGAQVALRIVVYDVLADDLTLRVRIEHSAPHTQSALSLRCVMPDSGKVALSCGVCICSGAVGSKALLDVRVLYPSGTARCDAQPTVEVFDPDAAATHALTIGGIEEATLLYLAARGIGPENARRLVGEGFIRGGSPFLA